MAELSVVPSTHVRKFRVQSWKPAAPAGAAACAHLGIEWPLAVGKITEGDLRVLCIGPTDWIVIATTERAHTISRGLQEVAAVEGLSVVEVSDALATLRLTGPDARDVLAQGTGVDLHPRAFPAGHCVRTRFAQIPAILHCRVDGATFECHANRSYQGHLMSWFTRAAGESIPSPSHR
ncbi:MAG TPA: sarcosine oxidase subunit gamma family protein [Steroidobacteraceae bacterium]|nr:sarcosine oxidase subunit gamma family protein [Steroidobacteraceae bacterium]